MQDEDRMLYDIDFKSFNCGQNCIPEGLGPPASCGSLLNITCICENPTFIVSIAGCEETTCSKEELQQIQELIAPLCAPVGGLASSVLYSLESYFATATGLTASGVPTSLPPDATQVTAVSAILATATEVPNLGSPVDLANYPECAQLCATQLITGDGCDLNDIDCLCGPVYRSRTAACEEVTCSPEDRLTISLLAQELCDPVYSTTPTLGPAVSSAIASATIFAASAVASKDPTSISSYPPCGQACQKQYLPPSGCVSLSNRKCVCQTSDFNANVGTCEQASCSVTDLQTIADISYELCNPVGGIGNVSNASYNPPSTAATPPAATFTGGASHVLVGHFAWAVMIMAGVLGGLALM
ncbi:hypothetical protein ABVK25_002927 [Lepraria finkii]|uniref:CFEM domain-containing protein n=1 Tax=Lepraria finkii TaxID=1340010 RepID=A0ABR4BFA9_9LECA